MTKQSLGPAPYILIMASFFAVGPSFGAPLIGGNGDEGVSEINLSDGTLSELSEFSKLSCAPAPNSLAKHPVSGLVYGVSGDNPDVLFTIDPNTGTTAIVGKTGVSDNIGWISTLTFGPAPDYPLYAIRGGGGGSGAGGIAGSIHVLDINTAAPTPTGWSNPGTGGFALEFNPDDGMLYNFYNSADSGGGTIFLDKIDPATGFRTSVSLSGDSLGVVNGIAYDGNGTFYTYNVNSENFFSVTPSGVVAELGSVAKPFKALVEIGGNLFGHHFEDNSGNSVISQINPVTGVLSNSVVLGNLPLCAERISAIARDPISGELTVVSNFSAGNGTIFRGLSALNPATGALSESVQLTINGNTDEGLDIEGITFGSDGQLYGVLQFDHSSSGPLDEGTVLLIDRDTGAVTDSGWATSGKFVGGHAIEYNPVDGLLYHFYPGGGIETIDPDTGQVVAGGAVSGDMPSFITGVQYEGNGSFLLSDSFYNVATQDSSQSLFRITSAGESSLVTQIGTDNSQFYFDGIAFGDSLPPAASVNPVNIVLKAKLTKDLKKLKKKIKKAKKSGNKGKLKKLKKKEKKLKKFLKSL